MPQPYRFPRQHFGSYLPHGTNALPSVEGAPIDSLYRRRNLYLKHIVTKPHVSALDPLGEHSALWRTVTVELRRVSVGVVMPASGWLFITGGSDMIDDEGDIQAGSFDLHASWSKIISGASDVNSFAVSPRHAPTKRVPLTHKGSGRTTQMNLKVTADVKDEFSSIARRRKISMGALLEQILVEWKTGRGRSQQ